MLTKVEGIALLHAAIAQLPEGRRSFASSLIEQFDRRGDLSQNQWFWVDRLTKIAAEEKAVVIPTAPTQVGSFAGVIELFRKAQENKRHPKLHLRVDGSPLVLSIAGEKAKRPGTVNLTDGKPFGDNVWFGRVTPEGAFEPARGVSEATRQAIVTILRDLAADPIAFAGTWGQETGICCFCGAELDGKDGVSKALGFGPVCAKKFGLSWGKKARDAKLSCEAA